MLHPATVHFAMILPLVASLLGFYHLIKREKITASISTVSLFAATLAIIVVWYTGNKAGPEIYSFLSSQGQKELLEHKQLGLYLAITISVIMVLNIIARYLSNFKLQFISIFLTFILSIAIFIQGKHGGEIVYKYGQPFQVSMINDTLTELGETIEDTEECDEQLEALDDALDEIISTNEQVSKITNK